MINKTESAERQYLEVIKKKIENAIETIDKNVNEYEKELREQKKYLYENKADMDHVEKVSVRQSVTQAAITGETALQRRKRLSRLWHSPWFGRIDFLPSDDKEEIPIYIGIHAFFDLIEKINIVHDWRAPVSNMFYDFELGTAHFKAPQGPIEGDILLKRQYRIRMGKMEYMLENSLNIHDDILQKELSKAANEKMKHIVATIQRDQNVIIRNETSRTMIIQGVAGSGKTSIALHRIAFLLYRFKETITSKDILIISPNKVFADYISNVLPELGEEKIPEKGMEELADEILEGKFRFQHFFEQINFLLENEDQAFAERIAFKATFNFFNKLNEFLAHIENNWFVPKTLIVKRYPVPDWFIRERWAACHRLPLFKRFNIIAGDIEENVRIYYKYDITAKERNQIRSEVKQMFGITNLRPLYKGFYAWLNKPEMFKPLKGTKYEYADVFPLIYLKIKLEGTKIYEGVKHLLIDEMQDYTPVQYAVISKLFPCKKTILGDANQSVNPFSSSTSADIARVFSDADLMQLTKSYRSTYEITRFAQFILPNEDLEMIERHGENPVVSRFKNYDEEFKAICSSIQSFEQSEYHSMGIITKTQKQAEKLFEKLSGKFPQVMLLDDESVAFVTGINVTSAHMAKGLEFDHVVVPFAGSTNYSQPIDRHLFYIACTRAMHHLEVFYEGKPNEFMDK